MEPAGRVFRLFQLASYLQSGKTLSAAELAELCGVSRRTIFRDINLLRDAGLPLEYDEEGRGFSMPVRSYLRPAEFTFAETLSLLLLCEELGGDGGIPFHAAARSAAVKLLSGLPESIRDELGEVVERISVRLEAPRSDAGEPAHYQLLIDAIGKRQCLRLTYHSFEEDGEIRTQVSPYRIFFQRRAWYVVGHSSVHDEIRTFNVGRIRKAELTDESYEIPPRFSLKAYFGDAWSFIREPNDRHDVVIRFGPKVAGNVAEVRWHRTQQIVRKPDGSIEFSVTVDGLSEIVWWVLGYGKEAEVIRPDKLRDMVGEHVQKLAQAYEIDSPGPP
ncbi:helix-turn-helix transcriptional regulator [Stratiformator vulcanicus]|uniref:HTH domain protein n=1 Tax=Stratiformator vulcanicus TaxID=2527980 RepID=A0A517R632_9PLAN|nr:YafY family protein [Stratiformator vulcanicus]QDT39357.1 HTH domain protein [Stratiformator vulcanicus]